MIGKISITDTITRKLEKLVKDFPEIGDYIVASVSAETKKLIEDNYMSGQVLTLSSGFKGAFYSEDKPGQWKITGRLFNLFETGKRIISNLSGQPIDTGLIDKRPILKPASEDMNSRIDPVLERVLQKQKDLKGILE